MESKFFTKCEICKRPKLYIAKRMVTLPIADVKSQKLMCGVCYRTLKAMMKQNGK